ncbi:MAG: Rsd/AlgQ family anti-sigma factor [Candidatus Dasytiphilus stammeri]
MQNCFKKYNYLSLSLVESLLKTRKQLLMDYYNLIGFKPQKKKIQAIDETTLINFCSHLLDYLSYGHFYVYTRILENCKSHFLKPKNSFIAKIICTLQNNTQYIMKLYDIYLCIIINDDNYLDFQNALSKVGEALTSRFILEDQLINRVNISQFIKSQ